MPLIEVTKCKNCEREWVTPLFDKPEDGLCGVCHEFDTPVERRMTLGSALAPLFDKESIESIKASLNELDGLTIPTCEV
jgi:hypothetical protein